MSGFRKFIMQGNLVQLATAFIMGTAFAVVVASFIENLVNPLLAAIGGQPNMDDVLNFTIGKGVFHGGKFLTALIGFIITAAVVYFFVAKPFSKVAERYAAEADPTEIDILTEIRDELRASK